MEKIVGVVDSAVKIRSILKVTFSKLPSLLVFTTERVIIVNFGPMMNKGGTFYVWDPVQIEAQDKLLSSTDELPENFIELSKEVSVFGTTIIQYEQIGHVKMTLGGLFRHSGLEICTTDNKKYRFLLFHSSSFMGPIKTDTFDKYTSTIESVLKNKLTVN